MMRKWDSMLCIGLLFVYSCHNKAIHAIAEIEYAYVKMDSAVQIQPEITQMIYPYKTALKEQMNEVVAYVNHPLQKRQPESDLGNFLADATRHMASYYLDEEIDIGIMNYGGIRLPSLPMGEITLGTLYELMPFDNYLVVIEVEGSTLHQLVEKIVSKGGWPVSGMQVIIKKDEWSVLIDGEKLEHDETYLIAISDYLANGGDHMDLLIPLEQENTGVLLREAFIEYFETYSEEHGGISAQVENRIKYVD